jgi:hypothetical protein
MADMYTPEEINEIFAAYNERIQQGIPISKELAQQMKDATLGVKNYTQQLQSSMKQLGTSFKDLGAGIAKGEKGASVFNDALSSGADAVSSYTAKFGPAGQAIGLMTKAAMAYVGAVNKQADALFNSYKEISRAGVIGAGGMKDVYANMQRFGYGIEELGEFAGLMKSNSEVLAKFGGTAFNGANQFAALADEIQRGELGKNLMLMGVSVDEINKGAAGFLKQQTNLGRNSAGMQKTLAAETAKYLENLEAVARLTGQSREQLQQKQEDAQAEQQFAAKQYELKQRALAGDMEAAKELRKLEALNETLSGDMRMDVIRSFAGDVAASGRLMTAMPGVFQKMQDASSDEADVIFEMTKSSRRNITDMNKAFQLGFGADTFYAFKDNAQLVSQFGDAMNPTQIREMMEAAKKNSTATDKATQNQVDIERAQRRARDSLQDFINLGINPVTKLMSILADVIDGLVSLLPGAGRARERAKEAELNRQGKTSARQDQVTASQGSTADMLTGGATATLSPSEMMSGLRIKSPEAYSGGETSPQLLQAANLIQQKLGGDLLHFSAFNDSYHRGPNSLHSKGRALDFTIADPSKSAEIAAMVKGIPGVSKVIDEYLNPSSHATGKHIHAEISAAAGAILSGPSSGYRPNLTMHGTEAVVPLPDGRSIPVTSSAESSGIMAAQLEKLDELVSVMKSQLSVSNKLLQYSS